MSEARPRKQQRTNSGSSSKSLGPLPRSSGARGSTRPAPHRSSPQPRQRSSRSTQPSRDVEPFAGTDVDDGSEPLVHKTTPTINIRRLTEDPIASAGGQDITSNAGEQFSKPGATPQSNQGLEADLAVMPGGNTSPSIRSYNNRQKSPNRHLGIPGLDDHKGYTNDYGLGDQLRLASEFSIRSDRGPDLESQHIARVAHTIQPTSYDTISNADLIEKVQDNLEPKLSSFFYKAEQYFLPWMVLHQVLSTQTVLRLLRHLNPQDDTRLTEDGLAALANKIAPPLHTLNGFVGVNGQFRRTFATLILIGREHMIFAFVNAELNDGALLGIEFEELKPTSRHFAVLFNGWRSRDIKDFKSKRWQLWPTFVAAQRQPEPSEEARTIPVDGVSRVTYFKRIRYKLRSTEEVLPFKRVDRPDIAGGFADVRFFGLHEDQQDLPRFTRALNKNPIAVKTLKNDNKGTAEQCEAYLNEVYVMGRLASAIASPHIAKLLATIEVSSSISVQERSDYHLVMEAADRNVENLWTSREWWSNYPTRGVSYLDLARWVSRQCYGLTDALWKLHEFPRSDKDTNDKTHGLHRDIKPDNLLHYENWNPETDNSPKGTVDERLGVIQLSDFGLSSFHSTLSVGNQHVPGAFLDYAAPETDFLLTHSPATDVWHFGCLFIDFATWLLDGPEGYEKFADERLTTVLRGNMCRFATFTTGGSSQGRSPHTTVEVNQRVLKVGTLTHDATEDTAR